MVLNASSTIRWVLVGLGGEDGLHTPVFENALLLAQGRKEGLRTRKVTSELAPTVTLTVDMRAGALPFTQSQLPVSGRCGASIRGNRS